MFGKKINQKPEAIVTDDLQVRRKFFLGNTEMELKTRKVTNAVGGTMTIQYIGPLDDDVNLFGGTASEEEHGEKPQTMRADDLQVRRKFFLGNTEMELKTKKVMNAVGATITIQYIGPVEDNT